MTSKKTGTPPYFHYWRFRNRSRGKRYVYLAIPERYVKSLTLDVENGEYVLRLKVEADAD